MARPIQFSPFLRPWPTLCYFGSFIWINLPLLRISMPEIHLSVIFSREPQWACRKALRPPKRRKLRHSVPRDKWLQRSCRRTYSLHASLFHAGKLCLCSWLLTAHLHAGAVATTELLCRKGRLLPRVYFFHASSCMILPVQRLHTHGRPNLHRAGAMASEGLRCAGGAYGPGAAAPYGGSCRGALLAIHGLRLLPPSAGTAAYAAIPTAGRCR